MTPDVATSVANQANAKTLRKELHPAVVLGYFKCQPAIVGKLRLSYCSPVREDATSDVDYTAPDVMGLEVHWPNPKHDDHSARIWHYHYSKSHPCLPPVGFLRSEFAVHIMPNEMVFAPYYDKY